jgi:hypothetical protein
MLVRQGFGGASGAFGGYGTVVPVLLDDLPDWLPAWCVDYLGGEPAGVLFQLQQVSMVVGLRLAGGRDVVVKVRADDGRAVSCVAAQARLAGRGFPCARPLTPVVGVGALAVHAEEFRPGGEVLRGDSPDSEAFLVAYQDIRGRLFTAVEQEIAWAASSGWQRTTYGRHCTAMPRWAAMRSAHRQPNASAGPTPSTGMRIQRAPTLAANVWPHRLFESQLIAH